MTSQSPTLGIRTALGHVSLTARKMLDLPSSSGDRKTLAHVCHVHWGSERKTSVRTVFTKKRSKTENMDFRENANVSRLKNEKKPWNLLSRILVKKLLCTTLLNTTLLYTRHGLRVR